MEVSRASPVLASTSFGHDQRDQHQDEEQGTDGGQGLDAVGVEEVGQVGEPALPEGPRRFLRHGRVRDEEAEVPHPEDLVRDRERPGGQHDRRPPAPTAPDDEEPGQEGEGEGEDFWGELLGECSAQYTALEAMRMGRGKRDRFAKVELEDGSILTAYYQKPGSVTDKCAFLWSRWRLPE